MPLLVLYVSRSVCTLNYMGEKRILVATGQKTIDNIVEKFEGYDVVGKVEFESELYDQCIKLQPDILLVGAGLFWKEPVVKVLLAITRELPNTRVVYLTGHIDVNDEVRLNSLALLVMAGVYDIIHEKKMTINMLKTALDNPKTEEDVDYIVKASNKYMSKQKTDNQVEFIIPKEDSKENDDIRDNLYVISSIKPGTGKSFLAANIATAIAKYGVNTKEGKRPQVGLIEADLQNLSLGTLLQIEDNDKNLKTVMDKIATIVTDAGDFIGNENQVREINQYIRNCFIPYYRTKNLKALVGSQLTLKELEGIVSYHYIYLIDAITDYFDVIIVDTNSALTHVTTYPLLHMAKCCYYILNLDFNNVRNNLRYKDTLSKMGITDKVKYILNEDINNETKDAITGTEIEELIFNANHLEDSGFKLEARIPVIPKTVFLNRLYEGTPIVLDEGKETENIRFELLKIANQVYPIENFSEIEKKNNNKIPKKKGFFK